MARQAEFDGSVLGLGGREAACSAIRRVPLLLLLPLPPPSTHQLTRPSPAVPCALSNPWGRQRRGRHGGACGEAVPGRVRQERPCVVQEMREQHRQGLSAPGHHGAGTSQRGGGGGLRFPSPPPPGGARDPVRPRARHVALCSRRRLSGRAAAQLLGFVSSAQPRSPPDASPRGHVPRAGQRCSCRMPSAKHMESPSGSLHGSLSRGVGGGASPLAVLLPEPDSGREVQTLYPFLSGSKAPLNVAIVTSA